MRFKVWICLFLFVVFLGCTTTEKIHLKQEDEKLVAIRERLFAAKKFNSFAFEVQRKGKICLYADESSFEGTYQKIEIQVDLVFKKIVQEATYFHDEKCTDQYDRVQRTIEILEYTIAKAEDFEFFYDSVAYLIKIKGYFENHEGQYIFSLSLKNACQMIEVNLSNVGLCGKNPLIAFRTEFEG